MKRFLPVALLFVSGTLSAQQQTPASVPPPAPASPAAGAMHLTLPEAEQLALKNNPRLAQAEYTFRAYTDITREFQSAYYPTLQGNVTAVGADSGSRLAAGALNNPVVFSRVGTGVTVNQLVTDFGRTHDLVQSASLAAQAQQQNTAFTKADLLVRTDAAFLAVLRTRATLTVARQTVAARQAVVEQVNALFQGKLKSSLDLSFAQTNLAEARLLLSSTENDVRAAEAELSAILAVPPDTRFDLVSPPSTNGPPPDATALIKEASSKRADVASLRLQVQSSQRYAQAESDLSRPTVGVLGTAGYVPTGESTIPDRYGAIGVNVNIPIFNGGLFRARRFEAESRAAAESKALENLSLQVQRDVRVAWVNANTAFERLGLTQTVLDQAKLTLDLAQARYNLGLSSIVELSQSQLEYTSAALARARAQYEYAAQLALFNFQAGVSP